MVGYFSVYFDSIKNIGLSVFIVFLTVKITTDSVELEQHWLSGTVFVIVHYQMFIPYYCRLA